MKVSNASKTCYEKVHTIPPSQRKIYFMFIGLAQVISKAYVNKPISKFANV